MWKTDRALIVGVILFLAGIAYDLQWHSSHDAVQEFETASKQVEVHWLLWLGTLVVLAGSAFALRDTRTRDRRRGYSIVLGAGAVYALVSVWHLIEHANGNDPDLPHVLLYAGAIGIVGGALLVLIHQRKTPSEVPRG